MKRRLLALLLTLALAAALVVPVSAAAVSSFDSEHSYSKSGSISAPKEVHTYPFEVPCTGDVVFEVKCTPGSPSAARQHFHISVEDENGKTLKSANEFSTEKYFQDFFAGQLSAGTYTVTITQPQGGPLAWIGSTSTNYQGIYYLKWTFRCAHKNTTDEPISEATCSEYGKVDVHCDDCGETPWTRTLDILPHTPDGEWVVDREATCSQSGRRHQVCSVCGAACKSESIDTLDHDWGKWRVSREATCAQSGQETRTCSVCGATDTRSISVTDHDWGKWTTITEATCRSDGQRQRACSVCGKTQTESFRDGAHNFTAWTVVNQATCGKDGYRERKCTICNYRETEPIKATGEHVFGETSQESATEFNAQCVNCGYIKHWITSASTTTAPAPAQQTPQQPKANEITVTRVNASAPTSIVLTDPAFTDVAADSWYKSVVTYAYTLGLMVGTSDTTFNPTGSMSLAEAVTMAARARNSYDGGTNADFAPSAVWYQTYVDYALAKGILQPGDFDDYTKTATRAQMAYIFARALPDAGLKAINTVTSLPDVSAADPYGAEIFKLYRAGVLTGSDAAGTFNPGTSITRSEAAAIITRMTLTSERRSLSLQ